MIIIIIIIITTINIILLNHYLHFLGEIIDTLKGEDLVASGSSLNQHIMNGISQLQM